MTQTTVAVTVHIRPDTPVEALHLPDADQVAVRVGQDVTLLGTPADLTRFLAAAQDAVAAHDEQAGRDKFLDHLRSGQVTSA